MADDGVRLVRPGKKFEGAQGVTYDAGVSRNTAGAETIAYMLKGECTVFHGQKLESQTLVKQGEQIFVPDDVPHAPCNLSMEECVWIVVHSSGDDQDDLIRTEDLGTLQEAQRKRDMVFG